MSSICTVLCGGAGSAWMPHLATEIVMTLTCGQMTLSPMGSTRAASGATEIRGGTKANDYFVRRQYVCRHTGIYFLKKMEKSSSDRKKKAPHLHELAVLRFMQCRTNVGSALGTLPLICPPQVDSLREPVPFSAHCTITKLWLFMCVCVQWWTPHPWRHSRLAGALSNLIEL